MCVIVAMRRLDFESFHWLVYCSNLVCLLCMLVRMLVWCFSVLSSRWVLRWWSIRSWRSRRRRRRKRWRLKLTEGSVFKASIAWGFFLWPWSWNLINEWAINYKRWLVSNNWRVKFPLHKVSFVSDHPGRTVQLWGLYGSGFSSVWGLFLAGLEDTASWV